MGFGMGALIGIEIGAASTAICVAEPVRRDDGIHFLVRYLERLPPNTSCVALADRYREIVEKLSRRTDLFVQPYLNATQGGAPFVEAFRELASAWNLQTVYFNHGTERTPGDARTVQLGKAWLVSRLKVLIQRGRLHLPRSPDSETLRRELDDYRVDPPHDANTRYGAFRVGSQDDLINALGLAVQEDIAPWREEDQEALADGFAQAPMTEVGEILEMYKKLGL
jgi:hypothetical protein